MNEPGDDDDARRLLSGEAWRAFCRRLEGLGEAIRGPEFPDDPRGRAEGVRALTRLLAYAARWEVECGDPLHPAFVSLQDPWNQWGGPNPDNVYLRAHVDPTRRYRVFCRDVRGVRQAIFSLHEGDMQLGRYGVWGERSLRDLEVGPDGALEIQLAPEGDGARAADGAPGNRIAMDPRARLFTIRIYQADWERDPAPPFHIERVGAAGVPRAPLEPAALARALDRAATWVERSAHYWNRYTRAGWERATPNAPATPRAAPGGADDILYGSCFWELAPGEALLLEVERPDALYWGFVAHTLPWLESGDFDQRSTSLNGAQLLADADDRVRVVVAHADPGVPNWIDTEQRPRGLLVYRWVWARSNPTPRARVLPGTALRAALPPDHPHVAPEERRRRLARRREAARARFR